MAWKKKIKKKKSVSTELCEGITIVPEHFREQENRRYTLLLKGFIVFLVSMGCMGALASSVGTNFNVWAVQIVVLMASLYCAQMQHSMKEDNIGYIILFFIMASSGWKLSNYINSGFYAICNDISDAASTYFDTKAMRSFGEQVSNRYLAVTIAMCYIGTVLAILVNIMITRHMNYIWAILVLLFMQIVPLYLMQQASPLYTGYLFVGLLITFILRGSNCYRLSDDNQKYGWKKHRKLSYHYASKAWGMLLMQTILLVVVVLLLIQIIFPTRVVDNMQEKNSAIKERTMGTARNFSLLGFMGLFNFYSSTGGLTSGRLGGVSSIRLDYNTDLKVTFVPVSGERVYLRSFIGEKYEPIANCWDKEIETNPKDKNYEYAALKKQYQKKNVKSAKAVMEVENVAAAPGAYLPYYGKEEGHVILPNQKNKYEYYPVTSSDLKYTVKQQDISKWMTVPEEDLDSVKRFCNEANLSGSKEEIIKKLTDYFQEHYPYTTSPGATPRGKDFVSYFLMDNKRGYCAHFASSAVLIFRYLGIPARYVEGYAFDYEDMADGQILRNENAANYYDGYSKLGKTNVLQVDVTDANAHAWVEVYDKDKGWQVVECTPTSDEDDQSNNGLWNSFLRLLGGGKKNAKNQSDDSGHRKPQVQLDETTKTVAVGSLTVIIGLLAVLVLLRMGCRYIMWRMRLKKASRNDRMILLYQAFLKKKGRMLPQLVQANNYKEQIALLRGEGLPGLLTDADEQKLITILNQAGFSQEKISDEQWNYVEEKLFKNFK